GFTPVKKNGRCMVLSVGATKILWAAAGCGAHLMAAPHAKAMTKSRTGFFMAASLESEALGSLVFLYPTRDSMAKANAVPTWKSDSSSGDSLESVFSV